MILEWNIIIPQACVVFTYLVNNWHQTSNRELVVCSEHACSEIKKEFILELIRENTKETEMQQECVLWNQISHCYCLFPIIFQIDLTHREEFNNNSNLRARMVLWEVVVSSELSENFDSLGQGRQTCGHHTPMCGPWRIVGCFAWLIWLIKPVLHLLKLSRTLIYFSIM